MQIIYRLFPANNARKITLLMLIPVILTYTARILIEQSLNSERGPYGLRWWLIICPSICLLGLSAAIILLGLAVIAVKRAHHFAPALVLLGGTVFAVLAPLPPLPQPIFPEETFFAAHRAEFEQVVALAREDQLKKCTFNCGTMTRSLPPEYSDLSVVKSVEVAHDPSSGLTVTFSPVTFYYPVIYFENPDVRNMLYPLNCSPDNRLVRKLDDHWYLCVQNFD